MRRTSRWLLPALSLILFFGAIGVAQAAGWWVTSGREPIAAGAMTADDLKGWMTLQQAADGLAVPVDELVVLLGAPAGAGVGPGTAFSEVEALVPGFELTTYRETVRAHLGTGAADVPAVAEPTTAAGASTPPPSPSPIPTTHVPSSTPTGTSTGTPTDGIRGSMTIREAAAATGVAVDRLLAEARLPADLDPDLPLRQIQDVVEGFEIQTLRDAAASLTR